MKIILINYINEEINPRFIKNEYLLKKNYNEKERIEKAKDNYYKELDRFEINVKDEIKLSIFSKNNINYSYFYKMKYYNKY